MGRKNILVPNRSLEAGTVADGQLRLGYFSFFYSEQCDIIIGVEEIGIKALSLFNKKRISTHGQGDGKTAGTVRIY